MNPEYKKCVEKRRIRPFSRGKKLVPKELKSAERDLEWARASWEQKNFKWCTVQAYYCMFHSARALLFFKGYTEKSHFCLYVAIRELFQKPNLIEKTIVDSLYTAMTLREDADYEDEFSKEGAQAALDSASRFIERAKQVISSMK